MKSIIGIILAVLISSAILTPFIVSFVYWQKAKREALNSFMEEYDAKLIDSSRNSAWLLEVDGKLIELRTRLEFDSRSWSIKPRFSDRKNVDIRISYYSPNEITQEWERKAIIIPSKIIRETDELPGIPSSDEELQRMEEKFNAFKVGELTKTDTIFLWAQFLSSGVLMGLFLFVLCWFFYHLNHIMAYFTKGGKLK